MPARAVMGQIDRLTIGSRQGNMWVYWTSHSIEDIEEDNYFAPLANHLAPTDGVKVLSKRADGSWHEAWFCVLHSEPRRVIAERTHPWEYRGIEMGRIQPVARSDGKCDLVDVDLNRTVQRGVDPATAHLIADARSQQIPAPVPAEEPVVTKDELAQRAVKKGADRRRQTFQFDLADLATTNLPGLRPSDLNKIVKMVRGKGLPPGSNRESMIAAIREKHPEAGMHVPGKAAAEAAQEA